MLRRALIPVVVLSSVTAAFAQVPWGPMTQLTFDQWAVYQKAAAVDIDERGNAIYVWQDESQDGSGWGIFGRRYANGIPVGGEFQVNSSTNGDQMYPKVAVDSHGGFVVVWGGAQGVFGRRFDPSGNPTGSEFQVNQSAMGASQGYPTLAMRPSGSFLVIWQVYYSGQYRMYFRRFDAAAAAIGPESRVNPDGLAHERSASVALTHDDGRFVIVYHHGGAGIVGQAFSPAGEQLGGFFPIDATDSSNPAIAAGSDGTYVVVWTDRRPLDGHGTGVVGQRFNAANQRVGPEFLVNEVTTGFQFITGQSVAADENGNFVVAWTSTTYVPPTRGSVLARRFDASGSPRGGEFQVSQQGGSGYTYGSRHVDSDRAGNFVVTWAYFRDLYAWSYGGLLPLAAQVDATPSGSSDGNGMLEAGETVAVTPSWTNANTFEQVFDGVARSFGGPSGPTYTLADASAAYGLVHVGGTGSCQLIGDCYAVGVSAPAGHPTPHWDAILREDVVPDVLGQTKNWRIHVGLSFSDVPRTDTFYRFVETLFHVGVTAGCGPLAFCPTDPATRQQMAVFALVAREGISYLPPACGTPVFADVPATSPFCRYVEELVRRGVVGGCGGGLFCPDAQVTRDQMAVFMLRTAEPSFVPPPCVAGSERFADVPAASGFCPWVEELARRGVVAGCSGSKYCPAAPVTRAQMAVFLTVTFGLTLNGV